jgi:hypothetical protein
MRANIIIPATIQRMVPVRFSPSTYLMKPTRQRTECRVQKGPFAGMNYTDYSVCNTCIPEFLGIYNRELASCVEQICVRPRQLIVDLVAAKEYYAVELGYT